MRWLTVLCTCLLAIRIRASELKPWLKNQKIGVTIVNAPFPETFSKDLKSGFTNQLLVQANLGCGSARTLQKRIEIGIKFDLWEDAFLVTTAADSVKVAQFKYSSEKEVMMFLTQLKLMDLFPAASVSDCSSLTLSTEILLNPIAKEKAEKIKKWVAENSVSVPNALGGSGASPADAPRSSRIFNKIFEEYAKGADITANWKASLSTKPFAVSELPHEK